MQPSAKIIVLIPKEAALKMSAFDGINVDLILLTRFILYLNISHSQRPVQFRLELVRITEVAFDVKYK